MKTILQDGDELGKTETVFNEDSQDTNMDHHGGEMLICCLLMEEIILLV